MSRLTSLTSTSVSADSRPRASSPRTSSAVRRTGCYRGWGTESPTWLPGAYTVTFAVADHPDFAPTRLVEPGDHRQKHQHDRQHPAENAQDQAYRPASSRFRSLDGLRSGRHRGVRLGHQALLAPGRHIGHGPETPARSRRILPPNDRLRRASRAPADRLAVAAPISLHASSQAVRTRVPDRSDLVAGPTDALPGQPRRSPPPGRWTPTERVRSRR
jgi:hypothetical protein